jgi:type IV secretion system protein VirB3
MSALPADPLFGARTRPQMVAGVTYSYAVFNLIVTIELFLMTHRFAMLLLALVIHVAGVMGCLRDPRIFDLWLTRVSRCPRVRNFGFWAANSYSP